MFKKIFLYPSNQKGVSVVLAVIILAIITSAALGISVILLQETKMAIDVGNSVVAFLAAESGIEEVLMTKQNPASACTSGSPCILDNDASYYLDISTPGGECSADNFCIKSVGIFKNTRRGIEINY